MPLLHVPPTEIVAPNTEVNAPLAAAAKNYVAGLLRELNLQRSLPEETAFFLPRTRKLQGSEYWKWNGKSDVVLYSYFLLPPGLGVTTENIGISGSKLLRNSSENSAQALRSPAAEEFWKAAALVEAESCRFLGAVWENGRAMGKITGVPEDFLRSRGGVPISQVIQRALQPVSPVVLDIQFQAEQQKWIKSLNIIAHTVLGEGFAAAGVPVISSLSKLHCVNTKQGSAAGKRPHRVVRITYGAQKDGLNKSSPSSQVTWPSFRTELFWSGGVFLGRIFAKDKVNVQPFEVFNPLKTFSTVKQSYDPLSHNLEDPSLKILSRQGRFVYLNRGRAYGLQIGMHLIGPVGQKLHVIKFEKELDEPDRAVALIRQEAGASIKEGDILQIDPTQFPVPSSQAPKDVPPTSVVP